VRDLIFIENKTTAKKSLIALNGQSRIFSLAKEKKWTLLRHLLWSTQGFMAIYLLNVWQGPN
jgi:hypothetical protein